MATTPEQPGSQPGSVTMQEVAVRCGVHQSTVQRALAGSSKVRPRTAEKIVRIATEMNYRPELHQSARRLAHQRHGTPVSNHVLALLLTSDFPQPAYFHAIFQGIAGQASREGYDLLWLTREYDAPEAPLPLGLIRGDADGAIFICSTDRLPALTRRLRAEPGFGARPLVSLLQPAAGCSAVLADEYGGAYAAATHLLELGHRHLLHFHDPRASSYFGQQRLAGHRQACSQHGLDPGAHLHFTPLAYGGPDRPLIAPVLRRLREDPQITGVLAANDLIATALVDALAGEGRRVPEDLSVVGFDDTHELLNGERRNILTTVRVPLQEVGREAAALLIQRVEGRTSSDRFVSLPVSLVVRGSTLPSAEAHPLPPLPAGKGVGESA